VFVLNILLIIIIIIITVQVTSSSSLCCLDLNGRLVAAVLPYNVYQVTVNHIFLNFVLISHNPTVNIIGMNFKRLKYQVFRRENVT